MSLIRFVDGEDISVELPETKVAIIALSLAILLECAV